MRQIWWRPRLLAIGASALLTLSACGGGGVTSLSAPSTASGASSTTDGGASPADSTSATGVPGTGDEASTSTTEEVIETTTTLAPPPTEARPGTLTGSLYRDDNHNGERDADEPGIPGILVSTGDRLAITDANGVYSISGLDGVGSLRVHTAWFRTQCEERSCDPGPGSANDFEVVDQEIVAKDVDTTPGAVLDAGLVPDWGGSGEGEISYPMPEPGAAVANAVDVALKTARLPAAGKADECDRSVQNEHLCAAGDHPTALVAVLNQGTTALTDVEVSLDAPLGMSVDLVSASPQYPNPTQGTPMLASPTDADTNTATLSVPGPIVPGGVAYAVVRLVVHSDAPGTAKPYPTATPYDRTLLARVIAVEPAGEVDSALCPTWSFCASGPGVGDKLLDGDETDGIGWNVEGAEPGTQIDAVSITVVPQTDAPTTLDLTVTNTGTTMIRNIVVAVRTTGDVTADVTDQPSWAAGSPTAYTTIWPGQLLPGGATSVTLVLSGTAGSVEATISSISRNRGDPRTDTFPSPPFADATATVQIGG